MNAGAGSIKPDEDPALHSVRRDLCLDDRTHYQDEPGSEPLERLARDGELMAFRHGGFFYAMDTYREYQYLNEIWASGRAPWKVWE